MLLYGPTNSKKIASAKKQRGRLMNELYESETKYLETLEALLAFREEIKNHEKRFPDNTKQLLLSVFEHVNDIYMYHKKYFLDGFLECIDNPKELGRLLTEHKEAIKDRYIKFCLKYNLARDVASYYSTVFTAIQLKLKFNMEVIIKAVYKIRLMIQ